MPGTIIPNNAPGYVPLYNKTLGAIGFIGKPTINIQKEYYIYQQRSYASASDIKDIKYNIPNPDYSSYLVINPELSSIASVTIRKQDIILKKDFTTPYAMGEHSAELCDGDTYSIRPYLIEYRGTGYMPYYTGFNMAVRFVIDVIPNDGTPPSTIIKTFAIEPNILNANGNPIIILGGGGSIGGSSSMGF
jgi:hypothetical protein